MIRRNMIAFFELAHLTPNLGVDLFHFVAPTKASLRGALDYVAPYTIGAAGPWPYEEETPFDHGKFFQIFRMASLVFNDSKYEAMVPQLPGNVNYTTNVLDLIWPKKK